MRILNETLLSAASVATTATSAPLLLEYAFGYSIQCVFTGTPTGTLILQASDDFNPAANFNVATFEPTNWTSITGSSTNITAAGNVLFNTGDIYYRYVRAVYTPVSGSGTLTIVGNAKGF